MAEDFTITINHPQRRIEWLEMFGTTSLPVKLIIPEFAIIPGDDQSELVYYVDLDLLTPQQRQRLVWPLAQKFNMSSDQINGLLAEQDIPVPAADCTLMVKNPHKWLG